MKRVPCRLTSGIATSSTRRATPNCRRLGSRISGVSRRPMLARDKASCITSSTTLVVVTRARGGAAPSGRGDESDPLEPAGRRGGCWPNDGDVDVADFSFLGINRGRTMELGRRRGRASGAMPSDLLEPLGRGEDARQFDAQEALALPRRKAAFQQERTDCARAGDWRRRHPLLHRAIIRHQDRCRSGSHQ